MRKSKKRIVKTIENYKNKNNKTYYQAVEILLNPSSFISWDFFLFWTLAHLLLFLWFIVNVTPLYFLRFVFRFENFLLSLVLWIFRCFIDYFMAAKINFELLKTINFGHLKDYTLNDNKSVIYCSTHTSDWIVWKKKWTKKLEKTIQIRTMLIETVSK